MLLTLTTTHRPATELGYLLHKNPGGGGGGGRVQRFDLSFGHAHVYYPEATEERCTAAMLLDVDPVALVRPRGRGSVALDQYVNDRPYVASSFLSVAIAQVYGSALKGACRERPELVSTAIPLRAGLSALPAGGSWGQEGGRTLIHDLFEPLGYAVTVEGSLMDESFPEWGASPSPRVTLEATTTLSSLLTHLYVLVPVLDNDKHYWVGDEEVEKLLRFGEAGGGWLAGHPRRELIVRRYLKHFAHLSREALSRLAEEDLPDPDAAAAAHDEAEQVIERPMSLNQQRLGSVVAALRAEGARRILDLGCGEGNLVRELVREPWVEHVTGVDVSMRALQIAADKLHLERLPERQRQRIRLMQGSVLYRDRRLEEPSAPGFDAAALVEVIEHLDPPRLGAMERTVFEFLRPRTAAAYRRYCWPVQSIADLRLAPFHLLASEGRVHADRSHEWHMEILSRLCAAADGVLLATPHRVVNLTDPESEASATAWWEELTAAARGGEGMVIKPCDFVPRGKGGVQQPAVKCRGREYLRIIYGPEYSLPENLERLPQRGLGHKRALALREFALGIEGLERFARAEPLRRVHECVFAVLALESEPVDPRL
jgi:3' terminal RNA ribose 2'-O-methyltransferase Hen1